MLHKSSTYRVSLLWLRVKQEILLVQLAKCALSASNTRVRSVRLHNRGMYVVHLTLVLGVCTILLKIMGTGIKRQSNAQQPRANTYYYLHTYI